MMHYELILNKTHEQVERSFRLAESMEDTSIRKTYFDQAFGMVTLASVLLPIEEFDNLCGMWDEYKPKFESLVYGI